MLYLIAHKVRGASAFDIAEQMDCPMCQGVGHDEMFEISCSECDETGYWWVIPTSGHRAYPYHAEPLEKDLERYRDAMPEGLTDHYPPRSEPARADRIAALLAGLPKLPSAPIKRR